MLRAMRGVSVASVIVLGASCHLVSGVHELEYFESGPAAQSSVSTGAGGPCDSPESCASTYCVDGVCCENACDAPCSSCAITGSEGTCSLHAVGTDPESECTSGSCDASGVCVGANCTFGTALPELTIFDIAVRDDGDFFIVGSFNGTIDLGGPPLMSTNEDIVVARFSAMGGHQWSKSFGSMGADAARGVAIDKFGYVWITGEIGGSIDFGGSAFSCSGPSDFFLLKLNASGMHQFSQVFEGPDADAGWDVEIVDDDVFVLGTQGGNFQIPPTNSHPFGGIFLARFDDEGTPAWSRMYSAEFEQATMRGYHRLALSPEGDCVITGGFEGELEFPDEVRLAGDAIDGYLARVDANGNFEWSKAIPMGISVEPYPDVAFDADGNVYVAGHFFDTTDLGSGALTSAGDSDIFLASFSPDGRSTRWSKRVGDLGKQEARALVVDSEGTLVLTGMVQGKVDFGAGELSTAGQDLFLARFAGDGTHLFSAVYGDSATQRGEALAIHARSPVVGGYCAGLIDFGDVVETCQSGAFVAGFSP